MEITVSLSKKANFLQEFSILIDRIIISCSDRDRNEGILEGRGTVGEEMKRREGEEEEEEE